MTKNGAFEKEEVTEEDKKSERTNSEAFSLHFQSHNFFTQGVSHAGLLQSTYLGGNGNETGQAIAIHPATGDVYVTGVTNSTDFPNIAGGADVTITGDDAFVTRLSSNLQTIYQSTFLGGSSYDSGSAIAIHPTSGDVYVAGTTGSSDFPNIAGGADAIFALDEAFVSRLSSNLQTLYQSTYLGGSGDDSGFGIAVHPTQGIYVTGHTLSNDFPSIAGGADTTFIDWIFATETIINGTEGDDTQADLGTPNIDFILQYGQGGIDMQYAAGLESNDWIEQDGGEGDDSLSVQCGTGSDYISQSGGSGNDNIGIVGDFGEDQIFQSGGSGNDLMFLTGGHENDYIYQAGGAGDDYLEMYNQEGVDLVRINAGSETDTIKYEYTEGSENDQVFIDGGTGNDTLTIYAMAGSFFTVLNAKGELLFQIGTGGSVTWVRSVENITVLGLLEEVLYQSTDPSDTTGGPDTSYREVGLGEAFVAVLDDPQQQEVAIPTMTEWSMIIFIVLAGLGSVYFLRRQRRA